MYLLYVCVDIHTYMGRYIMDICIYTVCTFAGAICCHFQSLCTPGLHKSIKQEDLQRHIVYLNERASKHLRDLSKEVIQLSLVISTVLCVLSDPISFHFDFGIYYVFLHITATVNLYHRTLSHCMI